MPINDADSSQDIDDAETEALAASEQDGLTALQKVEALLAEPATAPEKAGDVPAEAEKPYTVASLAEKLQADPKAVYALEVPLADGQTVTLGALKDAYQPAAALAKDREAFLEERGRHEAQRRQNDQELQEFVRLLPREALDPRLLEKAKGALQANRETENAAFLKAVPEWQDPIRVTADRGVMENYVAGFGFSKADLATVTDHRLLRLVRAAALQSAELKAVKPDPAAKAPAAKALAPRGPKPSTPAQDFGRLKAGVTTRRIQPLQAVEQLLKESGHAR